MERLLSDKEIDNLVEFAQTDPQTWAQWLEEEDGSSTTRKQAPASKGFEIATWYLRTMTYHMYKKLKKKLP